MFDSKIALIHATPLAMEPVVQAFKALWPQAQCMNLLDDTLSRDLAQAGGLTEALQQRFVDLAAYAHGAGAQGILFTCSAFGPAIERAAQHVPVPVLKPNEAMFGEALTALAGLERVGRVVLVTTFAPAAAPMAQEFQAMAQALGVRAELQTVTVAGALEALQAGQRDQHDAAVLAAWRDLPECDVVMLGQFSMSHLQAICQSRSTARVLSSPYSAVHCLQRRLRAV